MVRDRIRRHRFAAFVLVAFGWSWTWDALYYALDWGETLPVNIGRQWGVPLAAVVVVWASDVPLRSWGRRVLDPRVHPALYAVALALPLFVTNVQQVLRALGGGQLSVSLPGPAHLVVLFVLAQVVLFGGTEELGWRGYLQPRLQERTSVLTAGFAIGVVWWAWHLPLFVGRENYVAEPVPVLTYTAFVLGASMVLGAFVNATDGRALPVMLMHGTVNLGALLAGSGGVLDGPVLVPLLVGSGLWWVVAGVLVARNGRDMVPGEPLEPVG